MKTAVNVFPRFVVFLFVFGCVSLGLNDTKVVRSKEVDFVPPPRPFEEQTGDHLDHEWKNPRNGNSISYMSDCSDVTDPDLESIQQGILRGVDRLKILSSDIITFDEREALHTKARGTVDGIETGVELLVYKKNGCIYTLNYVGVAKQFANDTEAFKQFMNRFRAP